MQKNKLLVGFSLVALFSQNIVLGMGNQLEERFNILRKFTPTVLDTQAEFLLASGLDNIKILESDLKYLEAIPASIPTKEYLWWLTHCATVVGIAPWFFFISIKVYKILTAYVQRATQASVQSSEAIDYNAIVPYMPQSNIQKILNFLDDDKYAISIFILSSYLAYQFHIFFKDRYINYQNNLKSIELTQTQVLAASALLKSFKTIINLMLDCFDKKTDLITSRAAPAAPTDRWFLAQWNVLINDLNENKLAYNIVFEQFKNFKLCVLAKLNR